MLATPGLRAAPAVAGGHAAGMSPPPAVQLLEAGLPGPGRSVFTTRAGGVSCAPYDGLDLALHVGDDPDAVHRNRTALADAVGLEPSALVFAEQVHGPGVAVVRAPVAGALPGVDALVTSTPELGLVVLAADCVPVLLADPGAGVVAAAHAGRQGLAAGVLQATVQVMVGLGAARQEITAVLGPAVCGRCYEVPGALAADVESHVPGSRSTTHRGTDSVDLLAGATGVLRGLGVQQVTQVGGCTVERADLFSYRRDGRTGRHAGLVLLR